MTPEVSHFADFQGLGRLRQQAAADPNAAAKEAAVQFEALLIQDLLKAARLTDDDLPLMGTHTRQYQEMFEQQVALDMARRGGFGLSNHILQGMDQTTAVSQPEGSAPMTVEARFVNDLMPLAQRVGRRLGVAPKLVLAQAALETGWGDSTRGEDGGRARNNYFGIKATDSWLGERVSVNTVEFRDGVALREQASFRAYSSAAESFADYEKLLRQSRYVEARDAGSDARVFASGLAKGGYATDPNYVEKLVAIADSEAFNNALAGAAPAQDPATGADNSFAHNAP